MYKRMLKSKKADFNWKLIMIIIAIITALVLISFTTQIGEKMYGYLKSIFKALMPFG